MIDAILHWKISSVPSDGKAVQFRIVMESGRANQVNRWNKEYVIFKNINYDYIWSHLTIWQRIIAIEPYNLE